MKRLIAIVSAGLLLSACVTTPSAPPVLPSAVQAAKREYVDYCAPDKPTFAQDLIQSADLNRDGGADYIVSGFAFSCRNDTPYCGSIGCEVQIFLSGPQGLLEQRFNGPLREPPRIVGERGGSTLVSGEGKARLVFNPRTASFAKPH